MGVVLARRPGKEQRTGLLAWGCEGLRSYDGRLAPRRTNKACGFALSVTHATINFARSMRALGALLDSEFCFVLPAENSATCQ